MFALCSKQQHSSISTCTNRWSYSNQIYCSQGIFVSISWLLIRNADSSKEANIKLNCNQNDRDVIIWCISAKACCSFSVHMEFFPACNQCLITSNCCALQKAFSTEKSFPLHVFIWRIYMWRLFSFTQTWNALETRDAVSLPGFPPNISYSSSLLHSHHNHSQLPCKHHNSLKDVCPDDGLQTTLWRTGNKNIKRLFFFNSFTSHK